MRERVKEGLAHFSSRREASGASLLIYHRVAGGSLDELDVSADAFRQHLAALERVEVLSLDAALDRLDAGNAAPSFVLTFDDGFADVHANAWPLLRARRVPFTIYLATAYVGGSMRWEGATARDSGSPGLTWDQLAEMVDSGLCTIGNHTHTHATPEHLTDEELDLCSAAIQRNLGLTPNHFAYTWGVSVSAMKPALRARFRSAATGTLGRNQPGDDFMELRRVPVRRTDPARFLGESYRGRCSQNASMQVWWVPRRGLACGANLQMSP